MNVEELRDGFERLTAEVLPVPDPYGRLLRRSRRRRMGRVGALVAGATAAVAAVAGGAVALQGAGGAEDAFPGWPITSDWTGRLIDSPTRGSLAGDAGFVRDLLSVSRPFAPGPLGRAKVLFAGDVGANRLALIADYADGHAVLGELVGPRNASAAALADAFRAQNPQPRTAMFNRILTPVVTVAAPPAAPSGTPGWTVVLAPAGCTTSTATGADSWQPAATGDWLLAPTDNPVYTRITCDGVVHQQGPTIRVDEVSGVADAATQRPARGDADPVSVGAALAAFRRLTQAIGRTDEPRVLWAGTVPDAGTPGTAVLVGAAGSHGPVLLQIGSVGKSMVALAPAGQAVPDGEPTAAANRKEWGLIATGRSDDHGVVAVRLPRRAGAHAEITNRLFVLTPEGSTAVEAVGSAGQVVAQTTAKDGTAVLDLGVGQAVSVRARDHSGQTVGTSGSIDSASGARVFGEPLVDSW
jgi:hypothetical protein